MDDRKGIRFAKKIPTSAIPKSSPLKAFGDSLISREISS